MSSNESGILVAALSLPLRQRAELAHRLLLSLEDERAEDGPTGATPKDVRERLVAIESGNFRVEDAQAVLSELRETLTDRQQESKA